jgi:acrylyl-CoA reductase (NADPH)
LPTSVLPFILRGVTLKGCESVNTPRPLRLRAWERLGHDMDREKLQSMTHTHPVEDVVGMASDIMAGKVRGRTVYEIG